MVHPEHIYLTALLHFEQRLELAISQARRRDGKFCCGREYIKGMEDALALAVKMRQDMKAFFSQVEGGNGKQKGEA